MLPLVVATHGEDALSKSPYVSVKETLTVTAVSPPPLSVAVANGVIDALSLTVPVEAMLTDGGTTGWTLSVAAAVAPWSSVAVNVTVRTVV